MEGIGGTHKFFSGVGVLLVEEAKKVLQYAKGCSYSVPKHAVYTNLSLTFV